MPFPELAERLARLFRLGQFAHPQEEVVPIQPRPLSALERNWVQCMLQASPGWENADIGSIRVVEEDPHRSWLALDAPEPQKPNVEEVPNSYAYLYLVISGNLMVIAILHEWGGKLISLSIDISDTKHRRRTVRALPPDWVEVSRAVSGFEA